jgi:septin family protein
MFRTMSADVDRDGWGGCRFKDQRVHALLYFIPPTGHA